MAQSDVSEAPGFGFASARPKAASADRPLRVLIVHRTPFGAPGTALIQAFAEGLAKRGFPVTFASRLAAERDSVPPPPGLNLVALDSGSILKAALQIRRLVAQTQPDIVDVYFRRFSFLFPLLGRMGTRARARWVLDIPSPLLTTGWRRILGRIGGLLEPIGYDAIFTLTRMNAEAVLPRLRLPLYEFPLGVYLARIPVRPMRPEKTIRPRRFVYVGPLQPVRRLDALLAGIAHAHKEIGNAFTVDFMGDGAARPALEAYAKREGLDGVVTFLGMLPHEEVLARLQDYEAGIAYLPVFPFGASPMLKTLEYMAAGLFALASDTEGAREVVDPGRTGVLFDNSPQGIGGAIVSAVKVGLPAAMLAAGRAKAEEYDFERIIDARLLPAYRAVLMGGAP